MQPFYFEVAVPAAGASRVQLCRTGSFWRADQGHFKITKSMLEAMRDNAIERGVDLPIKITHQGRTFAGGWMKPATLAVTPWRSGYGLFGLSEWVRDSDLLAALKAKRTKYISPEIEWKARRLAASSRGHAGEPIGPLLSAGALVLDPFFEMDAVQFARAPRAGQRPTPQEYTMLSPEKLKALIDAMASAGLSEEEQAGVIASCTGAGAPPAAEPPPADAAMAPPEDPQYAAQAALQAGLQPLAAEYGVAPSVPAILAAKRATDKAIALYSQRLGSVEKDLDAEKKARRNAEFGANEKLGLHARLGSEVARVLFDSAPAQYAAEVAKAKPLPGALPPPAGALPTAAEIVTDTDDKALDAKIKVYMRENKLKFPQDYAQAFAAVMGASVAE